MLAQAMVELFQSDTKIETIGIRHGEKMFEALASVAEMQRSEDMGDFMRISMDERDLNYKRFFTEGAQGEPMTHDYDSHNTTQLTLQEMKGLLLSLPEIQRDLEEMGLPTS